MGEVTVPISPLITRQRAALRRLHATAAGQIQTAYTHARQQVTPAMRRFADAYAGELARMRDVDEDGEHDDAGRVSLLWLHTGGHLASLRGPVVRAIGTVALMSQDATLTAQRQAGTIGQQSALALMRAIPSAPRDGLVTPAIPTASYGVSAFSGQPLANTFTALPPNAWQGVEKAAGAGVAAGLSGSALLMALMRVLAGSASQATLISQQEATGAYRDAVSLTFRANPDAVTGWVWVCSFANSCAACIAMHGSVHDASETLDGHIGCNCSQQPYQGTLPDDIQGGEAWFADQDAATQQSILGPAAYNAIQQGDIRSIGSLIDTSDGTVQQASLRSLGLDASDYLT